MTWDEFTDVYGATGTIRLGSLSITPAPADMIECRATMACADRIMSLSARATGPVGAMTSILHDMGARVGILTLRQRRTDEGFATFLLCEGDDRQCWAYGAGATGDEANINALIAGANRLLPR
ncbi:hypothetical protein ACLQ3C_07575 [Gordonia sp. DT30]|uniref:hypothetical protein n=1 Tax=Gordonia sp. DT30 TaxID=3416546 RepID=UPI003CF7797D